jgi:DNA repair photolyase
MGKMIISASRRTDIPAFYSDWFMNRLQEGFVLVKNPMNARQLTRVDLRPESVECIVFWTKNPKNMIDKLNYLDSCTYRYYFQFTLNSYNSDMEPNVPAKAERIETFKVLSDRIGSERVIWRYDPILVAGHITIDDHAHCFDSLAAQLEGYTQRCVISFIDLYRKINRKMRAVNARAPSENEMEEIGARLAANASRYGITIETCAETINLAALGIHHGRCIDDRLVAMITGTPIDARKDAGQRDACGCIKSVDIGEYNTCSHHCAYCYANGSLKTIDRNVKAHSDASPLLVGQAREKQRVTERWGFSEKAYIDVI